MNIQSWMIKSWATLEWYLPTESAKLPVFNHVSTQIRDDGSGSGLRSGDTVWVASDGQEPAGLAWEWTEVKAGLVMLSDPNSIITNLQFVDEQHEPMLSLSKSVVVNRLVHGLAWQAPVCALLLQAANPNDAANTAATSPRPLLWPQQALGTQAPAGHTPAAREAQTKEPLPWKPLAEQPRHTYRRAADRELHQEEGPLTAQRRAA